jgi:hypothetical protein
MWSVVPLVATPLILLAFLAAVIAQRHSSHLKYELELIKSAPEQERGRLIEGKLRVYSLQHDNLTREQKFTLLQQQINLQRQRWNRITLISTTIALLLFLFLALYLDFNASSRANNPSKTNAPQFSPSQGATLNSNETTVCTISNFSVIANDTEIQDGDAAPAGTTLIIVGSGDCKGGVRAARFNFDGQPYGEGAEKERSVTWTLPSGEHILCFEITVGEWLPQWRQCKTVIGQ